MRVARDETERALFWKTRKAAFPAMGRMSPNYFVQDGVIPRTKLPEVLDAIEQLAEEYGMIVANVFHAGDGNLHPLVCFDGRIDGEAARAEELSGRIMDACLQAGGSITGEHGVGVDKKRYMAKMFVGGRPRRVPAPALRVRPRGPGEPRQGDADAAAVRRGAGHLPGAPARGGRAGGAVLKPSSPEEAAALLREHDGPVRPRGGGTRPWGPPGEGTVLETAGLARIVEHNVGDFTAVLEAGVPLVEAQATFAAEGQMLAFDPPADPKATIGGAMATNDTGPLRHRYGGLRDLVVGTTVALSDGTLATSGGRVIKNVAGYDLGKLFCGSYGTLGLITRVAVRLHPLVPETASAVGGSDDAARLGEAAAVLAGRPLEADCLDVAWRDGAGKLLVRFAGAAAGEQAAEHGGAHARRSGSRTPRWRRTTTRCGTRSARRSAAIACSRSPAASPTCPPCAGRARRSWAGPASGVFWLQVERRSGSRRCARRCTRARARCSTRRTPSGARPGRSPIRARWP